MRQKLGNQNLNKIREYNQDQKVNVYSYCRNVSYHALHRGRLYSR